LWAWDGEKWKGGAIAGPQKEQFLDLSGLTQKDITVPTWAKGCKITLAVTAALAGTGAIYVRASVDGTTFLSGASDYVIAAPYHLAGEASGSTGFHTQAQVNVSSWPLTYGTDNVSLAQIATVDLTLVRATTSDVFTFAAKGTGLHNTSAIGFATTWHQGYLSAAASGSALTIKALRFITVQADPGSYIHIKWLGDDAQIPTQNAIPDAPSDGGEYVRVNGVWRLKSQSYDLVGKTSQDVAVPLSAKVAKVTAAIQPTANSSFVAQISGDGTTFLTGSNYYNVGPYHTASPAAFNTNPGTSLTSWQLSGGHDNTTVPIMSTSEISLTRANDANFQFKSYVVSYHSTTTYLTYWFTGYVAAAAMPGLLSLKALRFLGFTAKAGSTMTVDWLY
jgi:hypothetical protein